MDQYSPFIPPPPPPATPRRRPRRKKSKWHWIKRLFLITGITLFILFLSFVIATTIEFALTWENFQLRNIIVEGNKRLSVNEILTAGGVEYGMNYFLVDAETVRRKILRIPSVSFCEVNKIYPHTVVIRVREYIPYATVLVEDSFYLVDNACVVLNRVHSIKDCVGPLITGVKVPRDLKPGDYIADEGLFWALQFWYQYNQVPFPQGLTISEIVVESGSSFKVFFNEIPCETRWKRDDLQRQLQNLSLAMSRVNLLQIPCLEYIDLRFNNDVICK